MTPGEQPVTRETITEISKQAAKLAELALQHEEG
jgi:hypothetical protein